MSNPESRVVAFPGVKREMQRAVESRPERVETACEAMACLQFTGLEAIASTTPGNGQPEGRWTRDVLQSLFASLRDGQAVEFSYGWLRDARGTGQFAWHVAAMSSGSTSEDGESSAEQLRQTLEIAFGSEGGGLRFAPVVERAAVPVSWQCDVAPIGVVAPAGSDQGADGKFNGSRRQEVIVGLPQASRDADFDSVIQAGRAAAIEFNVAIRIEPMQLSDRMLEVLKTAYNRQRFGSEGGLHVNDDMIVPVVDEKTIEATLRRLRHWSVDPRGFRVHCRFQAEQPLPPALIDVIGREVFGGMPVVTMGKTEDRAADAAGDACPVRLANCFPRADCPLSLLPSRWALEGIGTRRIYSAVPTNLPAAGLVLGRCDRQGRQREVRLADAERSRHSYVMGATGTGKTTLLANMIDQDIRRGRGVCVIDPHGDLYADILQAIPEQRADDVVLMDLTDTQWPVGLNFLECNGPNRAVQTNFIVNEMMSIFLRLYSDPPEACGPMFETYMRNALLTVIENKERTATLLDVVHFFEDEAFRKQAKARCTNRLSVSFWSRQAEQVTGEHVLKNIAPYITSKLNQFTHNALLRPIIGQPQTTIDFRQCMDEGRIVLVNLAKGLLGELDMQLLGMLLVGKIFNAALGRIVLPQAQRRPFYLYMDEFQNMVTPSVMGLLSEARKFGLSLTLANQHLAQLSAHPKYRGMAEAVLGNVATMLLFRMGPRDANELDTYTLPYLDAHDLQHLPDHHVACRMLSDNQPVQPFVFPTMAPRTPAVDSKLQAEIADSIRRACRERYAMPRKDVERVIMSR